MNDQQLHRLFRAAAAAAPEESSATMPFGFDTRVVARWNALPADPVAVIRLMHRTVVAALALILLASAGVYYELGQNEEHGEIISSDFAIADSAVGGGIE